MTVKMRPIRDTIPMGEALRIVTETAHPLTRTHHVPLEKSSGLVLATDIIAAQDVPPFDRAAMDGYAVLANDTFSASRQTPKSLRCIETVHTGNIPTKQVGTGECAEIATGAPMPEGADAVVMVEETERTNNGTVDIFKPVHPKQHIGRRGADIAVTQKVLGPGDLLTPSRLGAIAALGIPDVEVYDRPCVALLSTGNEIVEPGKPLEPGHIYDINRFTLGSIVGIHGGVSTAYPVATDSLKSLGEAVDTILKNKTDILVFSGGSSVGEKDLTLDILQEKGKVLFHGISVKPGKPTVFGRIGSTPVFGMPGYPTSCLSNAYMLLVPLLRIMAHLPPYQTRTVTVPTAQRLVSTTGRHQFYTVRVVDGAAVGAFKASGDITSMSQADGYIEIPAQTDLIEKGEPVEVKLF
ncbi:MAG TPA: molybdenum cofactor biosynthesis protein [Acidobacteria bacterium]|nr:molybdenum cofactor biosynthesis protein [Acidobacteriota bacterium]